MSFSPSDIAELDGGKVATIDFPNPNDLTTFNVSITPDTGYWNGAEYTFTLEIPALYVSSMVDSSSIIGSVKLIMHLFHFCVNMFSAARTSEGYMQK